MKEEIKEGLKGKKKINGRWKEWKRGGRGMT